MTPSPHIPDRVDLLERLQVQQMAINDVMRDALRTLDQALAAEQRAVQRYQTSCAVLQPEP